MAAGPLRASCCPSELCQGLAVGVRARKYIPPFAWCTPCILAYHHCSRVSFLGKGIRVNKAKEERTHNGIHEQPQSQCDFSWASFRGHLPLQKSHAISVFFLNLRNGLSSSSRLLAFRLPLGAVLLGLPSSAISPWPASDEEPSTVVGGPGTSSNTESSSGLTKSSGLDSPGRP